ncbi:hypothetical protein ACJMK2_042368 [Sinanodonta woodiana]|uniref:Uncharacterized protein n=1 Tax=Sinanodonta woodiana TaxID=1069815 RepID=A0ABD3W758_SINWO
MFQTLELETSGRRKRNALSPLSLPILPTPASLFDKPLLSMQTALLEGYQFILPLDSSSLYVLNPGLGPILPNIGSLVSPITASLLSVQPNDLIKNDILTNLDQINEKDVLTSYLSMFSEYSTFIGEEFVEGGAVDWQHYFYQDLLADKDEWQEKTELFRVFFKNQTLQKRWFLGHSADDLVHKAIFATRLQNPQNFSNFTISNYGNCFTLPSAEHIAWRSGPDQGITLMLNLEVDEYIKSLSTGYGVRMVIHKSGTYPFPTEEGFTLDPGREINIGLRMVEINRLSEPYNSCTDGQTFWKLHGVHYSVTLCLHLCHTKRTLAACGCLLPDSPDIQLNTPQDVPICNELNLKELCEKEKKRNGAYITNKCLKWSNGSFSDLIQRFHDNFLRVNIYYEDLNYKVFTEEPQYQIERFLADIGGASGLFIGASILSAMELFELIVEIFLHMCKKKIGLNSNSVNDVLSLEEIS